MAQSAGHDAEQAWHRRDNHRDFGARLRRKECHAVIKEMRAGWCPIATPCATPARPRSASNDNPNALPERGSRSIPRKHLLGVFTPQTLLHKLLRNRVFCVWPSASTPPLGRGTISYKLRISEKFRGVRSPRSETHENPSFPSNNSQRCPDGSRRAEICIVSINHES